MNDVEGILDEVSRRVVAGAPRKPSLDGVLAAASRQRRRRRQTAWVAATSVVIAALAGLAVIASGVRPEKALESAGSVSTTAGEALQNLAEVAATDPSPLLDEKQAAFFAVSDPAETVVVYLRPSGNGVTDVRSLPDAQSGSMGTFDAVARPTFAVEPAVIRALNDGSATIDEVVEGISGDAAAQPFGSVVTVPAVLDAGQPATRLDAMLLLLTQPGLRPDLRSELLQKVASEPTVQVDDSDESHVAVKDTSTGSEARFDRATAHVVGIVFGGSTATQVEFVDGPTVIDAGDVPTPPSCNMNPSQCA